MRTDHGHHIIDQIPDQDAYGRFGQLNLDDITGIIDAIHTNYRFDEDGNERESVDDKVAAMLSKWLNEAIEAGGAIF